MGLVHEASGSSELKEVLVGSSSVSVRVYDMFEFSVVSWSWGERGVGVLLEYVSVVGVGVVGVFVERGGGSIRGENSIPDF